jgi:hypothetical protein
MIGYERPTEGAMIDRDVMERELQRARHARLDAEAASCDVEDMIRQVRHFEPGKQRMLFVIDCSEPDDFQTAA